MSHSAQCGRDGGAAHPASAPGGAAQPTSSSGLLLLKPKSMPKPLGADMPRPPGMPSMVRPGGAAQPTFSALPANTTELTVGFYNVGIHFSEVGGRGWKIKERRLASDLARAFEAHALDILCISELGDIERGIGDHIREGDDYAWIQGLLADRAVPPVRVYSDGYYSTIVKSDRVAVLQCKLVRNFVEDQADRCFQHLRVCVGDDTEPVSIINCHAPASIKRGLTVAGRMRTLLACHEACAGDRFIWGGDFNTGLLQLTALVQSIDDSYTIDSSAAQPGSLQLVFSHPLRFKHGDIAMTYGLRSVQVNSKVGAFFHGVTDAHDLVVAKVFGVGGSRTPGKKADGPSPVVQKTGTHPPLIWGWGAAGSPPGRDAHPAKPSSMVLRAATPRVNAIFGSDASAAAALQEVLEKIGRDFLFGKVANIVASSDGCYEAATAPHITEKLEEFLQIVEEQRANHLRRSPGLDPDAIFTGSDMQDIHKEWMNDYGSWMNAETVEEYERYRNGSGKGDQQKAHQLRRSAFSAYLFQIIGNKHVLLSCIQHPICSAAQPADAIRRFMDAWEREKSSPEHKKRMQVSLHRTEERRSLKRAAHAARQNVAKARRLDEDILRGRRHVDDLTSTDQTLLDDFKTGRLTRISAECDAAFGWSEDRRAATGSASDRMGR